jgi:hypothetical protein
VRGGRGFATSDDSVLAEKGKINRFHQKQLIEANAVSERMDFPSPSR